MRRDLLAVVDMVMALERAMVSFFCCFFIYKILFCSEERSLGHLELQALQVSEGICRL